MFSRDVAKKIDIFTLNMLKHNQPLGKSLTTKLQRRTTMLNEQLRRDNINQIMSKNGDFSEKIQELLTSIGIDVYLSNLMGHCVTLHKTVSSKGSCTCYSKILGYDVNPIQPSLTLSITGELFDTPIEMLTYDFDNNTWLCHGKSTIYLKRRDVRFTTRIIKPHRELFKCLDLVDRSLLDRQISIIDPRKNREVVTLIGCVTVTTTAKKPTCIKIVPTNCFRQMDKIKYLDTWESYGIWNVLPGREVAQVILS